MKLFRSVDERLDAELERTGLHATIYFDRSSMQWAATLDGMSGRIVGFSEKAVKRGLLPMLQIAPTKDELES